MAIITKEFIYTGGVNIAEVPHGTTLLTLHLWGGAGGGGGSDVGGGGGTGSAGHYVTKTDLDMTSYAGVKNITVTVGGGGGSGSLGAGAEGGTNGKSISNWSGGQGGPSGPDSPSGSGGGGGGATVVTIFADGQTITNTIIATAGGGAGGGGAGAYSTGGPGVNTNSATARTPGTLGENGASHEDNGGGGGAGGGGTDGGTGGSGDTGDLGGHGGKAGSNTVPSSGSEDNGSGITPGGTGVAQYGGGAAVGGASEQSGTNGRAVLIFTIPAEAHYKVGGVWKKITEIHNKISGEWKRLVAGYTKVSGVWKALFANDVSFSINYAGFGNDQGGVTSGTAGTAGNPPAIPSPGVQLGGGRDVLPQSRQMYWGPITTTSPKGYQCSSNENNGGVGGSSCFIAGTMISMAEGSKKKIEDVKIGEKVLGFNKQINTVVAYDRPLLGNRKLYSINNSIAFVTNEHPFMTKNGWRSINPDATRKETNRNCDDLTDIAELKIGDKIITDKGSYVTVKNIKEYSNDSKNIVYNFVLDGNNTYFADGYCVHNKGIVCTSMYQTTGLEDWKRAMAIWRLYHKKVLGDNKEVQAGYHWVFKPFVRGMRRNRVLRFIGAWLARHVTNDMKYKLYVRGVDKIDAPFKHKVGKRDIAGKIILLIWQPFLTGIGGVLKMLNMGKDKGKNGN